MTHDARRATARKTRNSRSVARATARSRLEASRAVAVARGANARSLFRESTRARRGVAPRVVVVASSSTSVVVATARRDASDATSRRRDGENGKKNARRDARRRREMATRDDDDAKGATRAGVARRNVRARADTGASRGAAVYGEARVDDARDGLRDALRAFEAKCDRDDAAQMAALERVREHTRALERGRKVWDRRGMPGVERDWGEAREATTTRAPREDAFYAEYCEYVERRDGGSRERRRAVDARADEDARARVEDDDDEARARGVEATSA